MKAIATALTVLVASSSLPVKAQTRQSIAPPPSFDVATVKLNQSGDRIMLFQPAGGGRFTATNCSLSVLIHYAYDVMQFQIFGAPGWVKLDRYDISAEAEGNPSIEEMPAMVRGLLADRFQLKSHWETKETEGYFLFVSKAGKLREAEAGDCPPSLEPGSRPGGSPGDVPCGTYRNSPGHVVADKLPASDLESMLSFFTGSPVVDKTGLAGKYDIDLRWTPESIRLRSSAAPDGDTPAPDDSAPSIFTAVREQLGLELRSAKIPVKTLVIDHIERPSEN